MIQKNDKERKKKRKIGHLPFATNQYYIFCEGEQTEKLYFEGFKRTILSNPIYRGMGDSIYIQIQGIGRGTIKVMEAAEEYVQKQKISNAQVWCVYDKDEFPSEQFNAVSERAMLLNNKSKNGLTYNVAWSNQCIEYWFILHFSWYESDNHRKDYIDFLNKKFAELDESSYEKNDGRLFDILTEKGEPKLAIKYARKRASGCEGLSDDKSALMTKVYMLVEELAKYLPENIKQKYI